MALPNELRDETITDADTVMENFEYLDSKTDNLNEGHMSASTQFPNSILANAYFVDHVGVTLIGTQLNATTASFIVFPGPVYDSVGGNGESYSIVGVEHVGYSAGAVTAAVFDLHYGNNTDGWTLIKSGITTGTSGWSQTQVTSLSASTITTSSSRPKCFRLDVTTAGVSWAATDTWTLQIKLKRALRT